MKRLLLITMLLLATGAAYAHDAGSHCVQFGPDHVGCGGDDSGGEGPGDGSYTEDNDFIDIDNSFVPIGNTVDSFNDNVVNTAPIIVGNDDHSDDDFIDADSSFNDSSERDGCQAGVACAQDNAMQHAGDDRENGNFRDIDESDLFSNNTDDHSFEWEYTGPDINSHNTDTDGVDIDGSFNGSTYEGGLLGGATHDESINQEGGDQEMTHDGDTTASTEDSGNADVAIDQSDNSVSSYSSAYTYKEVYRAPNLTTQLNTTTSACINFIGIQMTGADEKGAGAMGLGIPLADKECRIGKAAIVAFQMENYEQGWFLFCNQKTVRKAWVAQLKHDGIARKGRKGNAIEKCQESGLDHAATEAARLAAVEAEIAQLQFLLDAQGDGYDDTELRRRLRELEAVAHMPNKSFLINHQH